MIKPITIRAALPPKTPLSLIAALPVKKTPTKIAAPMIISIRPKFLSKLFMCVFY